MNHPQLTGHGDPGNWASTVDANNISYLTIEAANGILPSIFEDCTIVADGVYTYQRVTLQSGPDVGKVIDDPNTPPVVIGVEKALDNTECNASKMAFVGTIGGSGAKAPYLLGPAYASLLAAMASLDLNQLKAWYDAHFEGPQANFQNWLRPLNLNATVQAAIAGVLSTEVGKLPKI